jgi:hypothetical protein
MAKSCHEARLDRECPKWIMFQGQNPNTGEIVAEWACADRWLPHLLADSNRRLIGVQSAVETRGDAVHEQQARMSGLIERAARGLPPIPPRHQAAMIAAERHAP